MISLNSNVRTGDILLIRGPSLGSDAIAMFARGRRCGGRFSHSALYVGDDSFLESTMSAVQFLSAFRVHANDERKLALLRLNSGDDEKDRETTRRAALVAHQFLAHPYDLTAALLAPFGGAPARVRPYIFCSALVALSYRGAGRPLFDDLPDHRVTPNRLFDSPWLEDKSDSIFTFTDGEDKNGLDMVPLREIAPYARAMSEVLVEGNRLFEAHGIAQAKGLTHFYALLGSSIHHPAIEQIDGGIMQAFEAVRFDNFIYQREPFREGGDALEWARREVAAPSMGTNELRRNVAQLKIRVLARQGFFAQYQLERAFHLRMRDVTGLQTFTYLHSWYDTLCLRYQSGGADMEQALSLLEDELMRRQNEPGD